MSITLDFDEQALASLPLQPGERERLMPIELACRFDANGWLSLGLGTRMAQLDRYPFGVALAARGIPRQYSPADLDVHLRYAGGP
jgi:predicted HTH domain antitoxin